VIITNDCLGRVLVVKWLKLLLLNFSCFVFHNRNWDWEFTSG